MLFWIKYRVIYFKIQRNETENGSSNIKDPSTETFQLQMPVLHQSKCISKAGPLRQECGRNTKIKYLMCQIPNEILEHRVIQTQITKFKDLCIKIYHNYIKTSKI